MVTTYNPYKINPLNGENCLDPYHTHFLLVDSGRNFSQAEEIKTKITYRDDIEVKLARFHEIPIIKIVLGEAIEHLYSIKSTIENNIPCLFIEVCQNNCND